jgi:5'(3')-deoxyribonucleotidase
LDHPDFFLELPLMEGSQMVIKRLTEKYEVFVTSAAMDPPNSFPAKYVWLKKHFPFITDKNIVFCGEKSIIRADFMIDDSVPSLMACIGQGIVFTAPHNALDTDFPRVKPMVGRSPGILASMKASSNRVGAYATAGYRSQEDFGPRVPERIRRDLEHRFDIQRLLP